MSRSVTVRRELRIVIELMPDSTARAIRMKKLTRLLSVVLGIVSLAASADTPGQQWQLVPGISQRDIYASGGLLPIKESEKACIEPIPEREKACIERSSRILRSTSASLPDGTHALINYIEVTRTIGVQQSRYLYKCVDYLDADYQHDGFACYELVDLR